MESVTRSRQAGLKNRSLYCHYQTHRQTKKTARQILTWKLNLKQLFHDDDMWCDTTLIRFISSSALWAGKVVPYRAFNSSLQRHWRDSAEARKLHQKGLNSSQHLHSGSTFNSTNWVHWTEPENVSAVWNLTPTHKCTHTCTFTHINTHTHTPSWAASAWK